MNREHIMRCGSDGFGQSEEVGRLLTTSKCEVTDMSAQRSTVTVGILHSLNFHINVIAEYNQKARL